MSDWRHQALCRDVDPEIFFPTGEEHFAGKPPTAAFLAQAAEAKKVCDRCPVMTDCRSWAVSTGQPFGVSGGTTAYERADLRPVQPRRRPAPVRRGRRRAS